MATVSEYLNILVGFDVPKLKAEAGKVNKELSDVDKKANNLMKSFGNAKKMALGFFAALAGTSSIAAFVANVTAADAALGRLSKTTGMSVEAISAWSNAAERAGGSAAEMQSGIANMSKELTNFKYTGESTLVPFLAQMGVSIVGVNGKLKDQNQIMLELADRAQSMPKEDFANLAMANGFNQSQVNLMLQGRKALQQQINEQNRNAITTKRQAEAAQQLETAWVDAKQAFMGVARTVAYVLVPPLTLLLKGVAAIFTFIGNHRIILVALFAFLVPKLLMTVKLFLTLGRAIGLLSPALRVATLAMRGFGLSTAIALAPLILIGTALALLFDDFMTFQAGGDSLIPWDKVFGGAKTAIQDIKDLIFSVGTLMDLLKAVGQGDWKAAASLGKKLIMDATPVGIAAKVADRVVTGGKNVDAVNKEAAAASEQVKNPTPSKRQQQPTSVQNSGDGFVDNSALRGLKIKSSEATAGGRVHGYVADFAKLYQKDNEANLKYFSAFNDSYHKGRKSDHNIGKAFDIVLKNANSSERAKAIKSMKENAAKYGYDVKIIDEYAKPSAHSTGGHIHVSVKGRKGAISSVTSGATTSASNVLFGSKNAFGLRNYYKYDDEILSAAKENGIPPHILKGLIHQESKFDPNARSHTGAKGLGQFTTIALKDQRQKGYNINPWDEKQSIHGAARILRDNYKKFGKWEPAIAAYNAGAGAVAANGNRPLTDTKEHREYTKLVMGYAKSASFGGNGTAVMGAKGQAALKASNGANVNSVHSETHIGNININTMATDAVGVAKAIPHEIKNQYSKLAHAVSSGMS